LTADFVGHDAKSLENVLMSPIGYVSVIKTFGTVELVL